MGRPPRFRALFAPGFEAVAENWKPFVLIQSMIVSVVLAYYFAPGAAPVAAAVARVKEAGGLTLSCLMTAFAGAVLPDIARRITLKTKSSKGDMAFQAGFFAVLGLTIDLLYRTLGQLIGTDPTVATVLRKLACDMLGYSVCFSIPFSVVSYAWREAGFDLSRTRALLSGGEFARRYGPLLVTCWFFWVPVLAAVYSMPAALQFAVFVFAEASWSLLLLSISAGQQEAVAVPA